MYKNIIIVPPCNTYGDILSIIGMVYFFLAYYQNVHLHISDDNQKIVKYYKQFFANCNKPIFIMGNNIHTILNTCNFGEYHICNVHTAEWDKPNTRYSAMPSVDKEFYFNDINPLYNKLNIDDIYLCSPNKHLPPTDYDINHLFYYKLVGLNNTVRMNFFDYTRDVKTELEYKSNILKQHNIHEGEKYCIINTAGHKTDIKKHIDESCKIIDIHNLVEFPGLLLSLIEDSDSIHLIEGSNVNFLYHCQFKGIITLNQKVFFHIYAFNRSWEIYKLSEAWRMMSTPKLDNWIFMHDHILKV